MLGNLINGPNIVQNNVRTLKYVFCILLQRCNGVVPSSVGFVEVTLSIQ